MYWLTFDLMLSTVDSRAPTTCASSSVILHMIVLGRFLGFSLSSLLFRPAAAPFFLPFDGGDFDLEPIALPPLAIPSPFALCTGKGVGRDRVGRGGPVRVSTPMHLLSPEERGLEDYAVILR